MPTISPTAKVLVTGSNGYIGLWMVRSLLAHGHLVRAIVRSAEKGEILKKIFCEKFPEEAGNLEYAVIHDITKVHAFDDVVRDVDGIVHVASPMTLEVTDPDELIRPAIDGTVGLLTSAIEHGQKLKRVVITSSTFAVLGPEARTYTEADYADWAVKEIEDRGKDAEKVSMYCASKLLAERAARSLHDEHQGHFHWDLTIINAAWCYGPTLNDPPTPADIPSTAALFYPAFFQVRDEAHMFPREQNFVDVRDLAEAHVRALEVDAAGGERIIVSSEWCTWQTWLDAAADMNLLPKLDKWQQNRGQDKKMQGVVTSNEKAMRILGMRFKTIRETLCDTLDDFRERGWLAEYE